LVFLGNSVEASEVDAKSKRAIFFLNKEDQSSMGRVRGMDLPSSNVFVNELMQSHKFLLGKGVNQTVGWRSAFVQSDFEIIGLMVS